MVDDKSNCDLDFKCELQKRRKKGGQRHQNCSLMIVALNKGEREPTPFLTKLLLNVKRETLSLANFWLTWAEDTTKMVLVHTTIEKKKKCLIAYIKVKGPYQKKKRHLNTVYKVLESVRCADTFKLLRGGKRG